MELLLQIAAEVGFPIAAALAGGYFVFLTLKFILAGVTSSVKNLSTIIHRLDSRVKSMNDEVRRFDTLLSSALGIKKDK